MTLLNPTTATTWRASSHLVVKMEPGWDSSFCRVFLPLALSKNVTAARNGFSLLWCDSGLQPKPKVSCQREPIKTDLTIKVVFLSQRPLFRPINQRCSFPSQRAGYPSATRKHQPRSESQTQDCTSFHQPKKSGVLFSSEPPGGAKPHEREG